MSWMSDHDAILGAMQSRVADDWERFLSQFYPCAHLDVNWVDELFTQHGEKYVKLDKETIERVRAGKRACGNL